MTDAAEEKPPDVDPHELAVDQAIAACDGDMRAAIKALVIANSFLEAELTDVYAKVSHGYARGRSIRRSTRET